MLVCVTSLDESDSSDSDVSSSFGLNSTTPPRRTQLRIGKLKDEMQHILQQSGFDGNRDPDQMLVGVNIRRYSENCVDSDSNHSDDFIESTQTSIVSKQETEEISSSDDKKSIQDIWRVFNEKQSMDTIERLGKCLKMIRNELVQMREHDQILIRQLLSVHRTMNNIVCSQYSDTWDSDGVVPMDSALSQDSVIDIKDVVSKIPSLRRRRRSAPDYEEDEEQEVYDPLSMSSPLFIASCYDWKTHQVTLL